MFYYIDPPVCDFLLEQWNHFHDHFDSVCFGKHFVEHKNEEEERNAKVGY